MYALTYPSPMAVEIEGSSEGPGDGDEREEVEDDNEDDEEEDAGLTLLATTEPVVETTEKHETSHLMPQHGSLFMSRPSGVPMISGVSSYPYPPPLSYGGYGRPVPAISRPPAGYPAFYYQHQHPVSPPKYVYYHQGYPMNRFFG